MRKNIRYMLGLGTCSLWLFMVAPAFAQTVVNTNPETAVIRLASTNTAAKETAKPADKPEVPAGWFWLSSDDKYSKFIDLQSVVAMPRRSSAGNAYETDVQAWTKTEYSYEGAKETLAAYGLLEKIGDPSKLSYSTALLSMNPQTRQVWYMEEHFHEASGKVIWSNAHDVAYRNNDAKGKEINSQAFDASFYQAALDRAFRGAGETARAEAKDRWYDIFTKQTPDGIRYSIAADTTTMRMEKNNLIFWSWQETKDADGKVVDVKFLKMAMNLPEATLLVINGTHWAPQTGWQSLENELDGHYRMIPSTSEEYQMVTALRDYAKSHDAWVNRYKRLYAPKN
ncbi:hypothetical protein SAMN02910356_01244 [Selenomonas sp. GACV-9]|uniref:hypothetical protein n=1 Tax=Selenomonas sp. GACV-9 TaxID=3158782 RepID=UPI0008E62FEB|nr:hypothetical protein SAMN02910356_01244 [Selenomonas ruminantium]